MMLEVDHVIQLVRERVVVVLVDPMGPVELRMGLLVLSI
jgi:hypothetical protein